MDIKLEYGKLPNAKYRHYSFLLFLIYMDFKIKKIFKICIVLKKKTIYLIEIF